MIRKMQVDDIQRVVEVHLKSFQGFFLSFLGPKFLALYYRGVCFDPEGVGFVFLNDNEIAGFVVGTSNPQGFYSRLLKRDWLRFAFASFDAVLKKPSVIPRIGRAILYPGKSPIGNEVAGLYSIGILPQLHGTGIGKKLAFAFLEEMKYRGCKRVFLTTDREGNDSVNTFYQKLGFTIERQFVTPEGRPMNEYWINLE